MDLMYYCEGASIKIFEVVSSSSNQNGEILFPLNKGGFTFSKKNCRKTLTLLDPNRKFIDGGVTYGINALDTEEEIIVK